MSAAATATAPAQRPDAAASPGALSPTDLAELMTAFNEVTAKLEQTHAQLRGEVRRLSAELREANEALQRSKRLAALGEMAAGIAHEVRNPLGSIRLYATMLEEDLADRPECRTVATKIGGAVRGLDAVVGDVLTFAREIKPRVMPEEAADLLGRAADACRAELGEVVRDDLARGVVRVDCDAGLLHRALVNLLRNAAEANRVGGGRRVWLDAAPGPVDPNDPDSDHGVVLSVRDEGDGMPAEVIERMFNPFFTTRATGTGLGLSIVHRIVDAHAGRVEVFNNADRAGPGPGGGRGATVALRLPALARDESEIVVRRAGGNVCKGSR